MLVWVFGVKPDLSGGGPLSLTCVNLLKKVGACKTSWEFYEKAIFGLISTVRIQIWPQFVQENSRSWVMNLVCLLVHNCIHQTRCIRIKSPSLQQWPFHWLHSLEIFCPSSYCGVYQAVPVWNWRPFAARQGTSLHTALKPSTQRRLCPPLFVRSFWARPVWTRSNCVGCRVGEEDRGGLTLRDTAGTLWWYRSPLW